MAGIKIIPTVNSVSPSAEQVAADTVDGFHASQTAGANEIPVKDSSGNLTLPTGNIVLAGGITAAGLLTPAAGILLNGTSSYKIFGNAVSGSTSSYIEPYEATNGSMTLNTSYTTSKIILKTQDTTRVEVSSVGVAIADNVLIGATTDAGTGKLQVDGDIALSSMTTYSSATAGVADALPAAPAGYLKITLDGSVRKIPYYE